MKLLGCHIEGFGALRNYDVRFDCGLNAIYAPNGGGKTTLCAFIRAMFYGLPADTVRSRFNERRHYYPFSGGKFGGNITFERGGDVYRIERFFDRTSGDQAKVYCNDALCTQFSGDIGAAFFGLDEQSFERTLFISSDWGELSPTGGINARLGEYAEQSSGVSRAEEAVSCLEKAAKNLSARGGRGVIPALEGKVKKLQAEVAQINEVSERLSGKYAAINALSQRIAELGGEGEGRARLEEAGLSLSGSRERLKELEARYPSGMPSAEDIAALNLAAGAQSAARGGKKEGSVRAPAALSFALSAILIAAGAALLPFSIFAGIASLGAGALFFVATLIVLLAVRKPAPAKAQSAADAVLHRFGMESLGYSGAAAALSAAAAEHKALSDEVKEREERMEALSSRLSGGADLSAETEKLRRQLAAAEREVADDESLADNLPRALSELDGALSELEEARSRYHAFTAAAEYIAMAERDLGDKFVAPVARSFEKYSSALRNALGASVSIDGNLCVSFEGGGEKRSDGHMSAGQRAVVALCFRLALADNIFGGDCPFVILDDPFPELDEEHMSRAAALMRELARDRQIIYLYCNSSRAIAPAAR